MGMDREVRFACGLMPSWESVREHLLRVGELAPIRMIDGLPAFPDEVPGATWSEIRLGFAAGMVTVRAGTNLVKCVIWGNSDDKLIAAWNKLCWAWAAAGFGLVIDKGESLSPSQFAELKGIKPA